MKIISKIKKTTSNLNLNSLHEPSSNSSSRNSSRKHTPSSTPTQSPSLKRKKKLSAYITEEIVSNNRNVDLLPKDIWINHICKFLQKKDLKHLRTVNRWFWKEIVVLPIWKQWIPLEYILNLNFNSVDKEHHLNRIYGLFTPKNFQFDPKQLRFFPPSLIELSLENTAITDLQLRLLPTNLVKLDLSYCRNITDQCLKLIPTSVKELILKQCPKLTDEGIAHIPDTVVKLNLSYYYKTLTNKALETLPSSLQELNIYGCSKINDEGILLLPTHIKMIFKSPSMDYTPLMYFCDADNLDKARLIIEKGVNVNQTNSKGYTALHFSSKNGSEQTVSFLLEHGADPNKGTFDLAITPLYLSLLSQKLEICELLLKKGADPNKKWLNNRGFNGLEAWTPLFYVSSTHMSPAFLDLLLTHKANPDIICSGARGKLTPLYLAFLTHKHAFIDTLKLYSNIRLNIELAKSRQDSKGIEFFQSLLK